jgi:glycerol-3-phosphate cytidylyltransferase
MMMVNCMANIKKIITYGTYDLIHKGHIRLLKRARELGDYLIVGLSTDEFNKLKNKKSYYEYEERKYILESIKYVDEVIPENSWEQKIEDIKRNNVSTFVIGQDWVGKFDFLKEYCQVLYLPRTEGISTTKIKHDLHTIVR